MNEFTDSDEEKQVQFDQVEEEEHGGPMPKQRPFQNKRHQ